MLISSNSMLERVYIIIIDQSPLPVTKQDFRIKALSTVCFPRQFKTWVSYKSCITRPIVTGWLERSPCFRYNMFGAGLALLDESDYALLHFNISQNESKISLILPVRCFGISRDCKLTKNLV